MTPDITAVLRDLEERAIKADRPDIVVDLAHISFLLEYVCQQLDFANEGRQPESEHLKDQDRS